MSDELTEVAPRCFRFEVIKTGVEFTCFEDERIFERVTMADIAENKCLGECDPETGELLIAPAPKRGRKPKAEEPAATVDPTEATE